MHGLGVQRCLLHTEPEEGGIVGRRELKADAAVDHRYGFRVRYACQIVATPEGGRAQQKLYSRLLRPE